MERPKENAGNPAKDANTERAANGQEEQGEILPVEFKARIHSLNPGSSIRASASVNINGCIAVRGIKVVEGGNGLFVSMPSYKGANNEFKDICFPVTAEARAKLQEAVLTAYRHAVKMGQESLEKHTGTEEASEKQQAGVLGMQKQS